MSKRAYRSIAVKNVKIQELLSRLAPGQVSVGVDVAKNELLVSLRDNSGAFQRPWKVQQPDELGQLIECLRCLAKSRPILVSMESTGTYGDCLRQALMDAGITPHRVSAKAVSDYCETFDGVPSKHDGKDAAMIAELAAFGKATPWPLVTSSDWQVKVERQVQWMDTQQEILMLWLGRLEALLSRHWPELQRFLKLNSATVLQVISHYGDPAALASCPEAEQQLRKWGRAGLSEEKIRAVLGSARSTVGVRMLEETRQVLRDYARKALEARQEIQQAKKALKELAEENESIVAMSQVVGPATACVLWVSVGDPHDFHCGEAYRKAMGLNLRERSSGKHQGKLKITKRGSAMARRWLYFAGLRVIQEPALKPWYLQKKAKDQDRGSGAVVAVMRKLALALYAVTTRQEPFDVNRLMPGRPMRPGLGQASSSGGSPPDPKDLTLVVKNEGEGAAENCSSAHPPSFPTPGMALGSVPTVALSSTQDKN